LRQGGRVPAGPMRLNGELILVRAFSAGETSCGEGRAKEEISGAGYEILSVIIFRETMSGVVRAGEAKTPGGGN